MKPDSLYKYVTIQTLHYILSGGVRFTQPSAFNDPFELLPELRVPADAPETPITFSFDIMAKRRLPPVGEVDEDNKTFNCSDIISRDIIKELNSSIGIFCLSKSEDSLLMWSHYASTTISRMEMHSCYIALLRQRALNMFFASSLFPVGVITRR